MPYPETAEAFCIHDHAKWDDFKKIEVKLKKFEDRDVDIAIDGTHPSIHHDLTTPEHC
jgi:alcohol dehydrogenase (NADP+)